MKLSQAGAKAKTIPVEFEGGAVLEVTYKPLTYTVNEMDAMRGETDPSRIIETVKRLVTKWDLTDDAEVPIPLDHPVDEDGKPAKDDPLRDVPTHIFGEIIRAVGEDQQPDPEASRRSRGR